MEHIAIFMAHIAKADLRRPDIAVARVATANAIRPVIVMAHIATAGRCPWP